MNLDCVQTQAEQPTVKACCSLLDTLAIWRVQNSLSASESMGVLRRCTARMSARPVSSGRGTTTRLDRRPGLVRAGSSTCTPNTILLIAPQTTGDVYTHLQHLKALVIAVILKCCTDIVVLGSSLSCLLKHMSNCCQVHLPTLTAAVDHTATGTDMCNRATRLQGGGDGERRRGKEGGSRKECKVMKGKGK